MYDDFVKKIVQEFLAWYVTTSYELDKKKSLTKEILQKKTERRMKRADELKPFERLFLEEGEELEIIPIKERERPIKVNLNRMLELYLNEQITKQKRIFVVYKSGTEKERIVELWEVKNILSLMQLRTELIENKVTAEFFLNSLRQDQENELLGKARVFADLDYLFDY